MKKINVIKGVGIVFLGILALGSAIGVGLIPSILIAVGLIAIPAGVVIILKILID